MAAADQVLSGLTQVQTVTNRVMDKFESYIGTIESAQETTGAFMTHGSQVLSGMMTSAQEQADLLSGLKSAQQEMKTSMRDYADWSSRVMTAVQEQADGAMKMTTSITAKMDQSSQSFSEAYAGFVDQLTSGFGRALNQFDASVQGALNLMGEQLRALQAASQGTPGQAEKLQKETEGCLVAMSRLQRAGRK